MSTYMDIFETKDKYYNGDYFYKAEIPKSVHFDHVFNENLSVKRNREMAIKHNQMVNDMQKECRNKENELLMQLRKDIVEYIVNTYDMTKEQANIVETFAYSKKHDFMCDYFATIDEVAEMVENVLKIKKAKI